MFAYLIYTLTTTYKQVKFFKRAHTHACTRVNGEEEEEAAAEGDGWEGGKKN